MTQCTTDTIDAKLGGERRAEVAGRRPIFRDIEQHFADLIIRNEFSVGSRLPSINEVAASMTVNKRTVLQAYQCLAGRGLVEVRSGRGTFVTDSSENGRITALGLAGWMEEALHGRVSNHYRHGAYIGIRAEADERNLVCHWIKTSTNMLKECRRKEVSGCILASADASSRLLLEDMEREHLKTVTIGGCEGQSVPFVHGDDSQGMRLLMEHLFDLGHRRIALFNNGLSNYSAQRRFAAYHREMARMNLDIHPSWICNDLLLDNTPDAIKRLLNIWFNASRPPTAIIAAGDYMPLALLQALHSSGIRVPEEVSVCGHDDYPGIQEFTAPALTTIRQPVEEIGRVAVRNLLAMLGGEKVENTILPVELIVRASTAEAKK